MVTMERGAWLLGPLAGAIASMVLASPAIAGICPAQVGDQIQAITRRSAVSNSQWGIVVDTLTPDSPLFPHSGAPIQRLYDQGGDRALVPASNAKVLVTAAALQRFGPDYRIPTSIYRMGSTEPGSPMILRVVGRGDPSLSDQQLLSLAQQLRDQGIMHIDWLIGDDSYFQGETVSASWDAEDLQAGYGAPTNSLILNQNAIGVNLYPQAVGQPLRLEWDNPNDAPGWQVRNNTTTVPRTASEYIVVGRDMAQSILYLSGQLWVGSEPDLSAVAVTQPGDRFLERFQQVLAEQGITVGQAEVVRASMPDPGIEIAAVESLPMVALVTEANRYSTNLYAEALLRQLAVAENGDRARTSALQAGQEAIAAVLAPLGVDSSQFRLSDGSGLSRQNSVTPAVLVDTLQAMGRSPDAQLYRDSLAVAGTSGTLRNRFRDTSVAGRLWGKTGTLRDVVALSGYLYPPNYDPVVFSILVNDPNLSLGAARQAMDDIILTLQQLQSCS
ncbi:MAG: D-alanyl-D-alanine carboxypeptidase/D-alanyl-D-alanine-endopeptidase [Synechococcales cyanobacterium K44_A2020_017]|nr:D-alanyl-D-alanine carboxypeptidase/D-alanyl-D-alanine-endopeptidase [Synechococcales cyanobacterium K32_A2020_035]MBF2095183.1 D-alanyl-D-alanine carboxypeptidase/D-alanyl-D-alanine-endopeptidase [Synechococcales cyanobacterium K44_A2020_017]